MKNWPAGLGAKSQVINNILMNTKLRESAYLKNIFSLLILVIIIIFFSIQAPGFLSYISMVNIFRASVFLVVTGVGATILLVSGNLDLSVGSTLALSCVLFALGSQVGLPLWIAFLLAVLAGSVVGLLNGLLVVNLKITSVIATLGTMYFIRGIVFIIMGDVPSILPGQENFTFIGRGFIGPIPFQILIIVAITALFLFIERRSLLWKYAVAIGCNRVAATLSGININLVINSLYVITGTLAGLSGAILASRLSVGQKLVGYGFEFDVVIAILLGGTDFRGGQGSIIGTVIGAFVVSILGIGLNMMGVDSFYQYVVKGIVLVVVVFTDKFLKERVLCEVPA